MAWPLAPSGATSTADLASRWSWDTAWLPDEVSETSGAAPALFVSYVREDGAAVERLVADLRSAGFTVWWDRDIPAGCVWRDWIAEHIRGDDFLVPCFSRNVRERAESYFYEELQQAIERMRQTRPGSALIMPVRLDDCERSDFRIHSTLRLSDLQWTDVFGERRNEGVTRLVTGLRGAFGPQAPTLVPQPRRVITTEDRAMALLGGLYDMVGGDPRQTADFRDVESVLGWPPGSAGDLPDLLLARELVDAHAIGGTYCVTATGIDTVEETRATVDEHRTAMAATLFALMMHVLAGQRPGRFVQDREVGEALGWPTSATDIACLYAEAAGGVESVGIGGVMRVASSRVPVLEDEIARLADDGSATDIADLLPAAQRKLRAVGLEHAKVMAARRDRTVQLHMRFLQEAVERYRAENGAYPSSLDDLVVKHPGQSPAWAVWDIPSHPRGGSYGLDASTGSVTEARG